MRRSDTTATVTAIDMSIVSFRRCSPPRPPGLAKGNQKRARLARGASGTNVGRKPVAKKAAAASHPPLALPVRVADASAQGLRPNMGQVENPPSSGRAVVPMA